MSHPDDKSTNSHISEEGFTLIELLIAGALSILVTAGAVLFLISVIHRQPAVSESAEAIGSARNALEKITADLRQGESATVLAPWELGMERECNRAAPGEACAVLYQCTEETPVPTYECKRYQMPGELITTVATGLTSRDVFCAAPTDEEGSECGTPSPEGETLYVGVTLSVPDHQAATGRTVLEGGAALHNAPEMLLNG